jgi:hypothetical protein
VAGLDDGSGGCGADPLPASFQAHLTAVSGRT